LSRKPIEAGLPKDFPFFFQFFLPPQTTRREKHEEEEGEGRSTMPTHEDQKTLAPFVACWLLLLLGGRGMNRRVEPAAAAAPAAHGPVWRQGRKMENGRRGRAGGVKEEKKEGQIRNEASPGTCGTLTRPAASKCPCGLLSIVAAWESPPCSRAFFLSRAPRRSRWQ
jgi:hypothetical protein